MDKKTAEKIKYLCDLGEMFTDEDNFSAALAAFGDALALVEEPVKDHGSAEIIYVLMGNTCYYSDDYEKAIEYYKKALECKGGSDDPMIPLRLGECYYELYDNESAGDQLIRAYEMGGIELFEGENKEYTNFLKSKI